MKEIKLTYSLSPAYMRDFQYGPKTEDDALLLGHLCTVVYLTREEVETLQPVAEAHGWKLVIEEDDEGD